MISLYRWQGKVERAEEAVMIVKTRATLADAVSDAVKELHDYDTPAILVMPLESVEGATWAGCWRRPAAPNGRPSSGAGVDWNGRSTSGCLRSRP